MPNRSLQSALDDLASTFTSSVLAAIRTASMDELHAQVAPRGRGVGRATRGGGGQPDPLSTPRKKSGRLARRSDEEVAKVVASVVALVKKSKTGMRAEEIRHALGLDVREMPRVLKTGVATKKLSAKGQKRATTYSVR